MRKANIELCSVSRIMKRAALLHNRVKYSGSLPVREPRKISVCKDSRGEFFYVRKLGIFSVYREKP